jgi:hypothetical protein
MSHVLNFRNWYRVYESDETGTGSTPADLAALDKIQFVAEQSAKAFNRIGTNSGKAETLTTMVGTTTGTTTQMGLQTGQPYKVISFKTSLDPADKSKKVNTIKAIFSAENGVLRALVYKNGVQYLAGDVVLKGHGSWSQIMSIGPDKNYELDVQSGAEPSNDGDAAQIAAGIATIISQKELGEAGGNAAAAFGVPRGDGNVKYSKDHSLLSNFLATERAKATPTQKP